MPPCQYLRNNISKKNKWKRTRNPHLFRIFAENFKDFAPVVAEFVEWIWWNVKEPCHGYKRRVDRLFQFGTCCCDRAPGGTGHHSTPLKPRPDSSRLLSVPKIRGSSSGTSVLIGWRREDVCAGLASGASGEFLPWRPRQTCSALADVPGTWWSQYGIKIYSFESQKDQEHLCFGFISLSFTILELSKKGHYFSALPSIYLYT